MTALLLDIVIMIFITPSIGFAPVSSHSNKLSLKHFYSDYFDSGICLQEATCIPLHNSSCFGTSLPYTSTSIALAEDSSSQFDVQANLALWQGLRSVPRCWAHIQQFLCAVYMPKCENGSVFLPSQEMCRTTRRHCEFVELVHGWPSFLQCENKKLFPPRCRNPLQEVKFNTSSKCMPPLVETDNEDNYYHKIVGCGLQCQNPFFSKEEHNSIHYLISILASIGFGVAACNVVTFLIKFKTAKRYPGVIIIFCSTVCLAIFCFGWLLQFFPGAKEQIVCSDDGTVRRKQPKVGNSLCSITFFLIYFFLMASLVWFVILMVCALYILFKQTGNPINIVKKKVGWFCLAALCISLVLTVTVMGMQEVDGDSMSGICFVSNGNMNMRIIFLLTPIGAAVVVGGFFLVCVSCTLIKVKLKGEEVANEKVKKKKSLILKIGVFSLFAVIFLFTTFGCHAYEIIYQKEWDENLKDYIVCLVMNSANQYGESSKCQLKNKPNIDVIRGKYFCLFGYGMIMSLLKILCDDFTHEDSFGLNTDVNSVVGTTSMPRQYSSASDMSRHVSVDSYNQSDLDTLSMQISEQGFKHQKRKTRKERKRFLRANRTAPWFPGNKRGSDTSLQSSTSFAAAQKAGISARVTKSTSTSELGAIPAPPPPGSTMYCPLMMPPVNTRPQIQRQAINPPFTHGMTDNSHRLGSRAPSVSPAFPRVNSGQRYAPSQCSVLPNSLVEMVQPPVYGRSYDVLNSVSYVYFSNGMYPPVNNCFPGYACNPEYMYNPYFHYNSGASFNTQCQQDILPMNPIADNTSETDFFPIKLSDSEYTDTGMRSYDEYQLMTTQRLMQEHLEAQAAAEDAVAAQAAAAAKDAVPTPAAASVENEKQVSVVSLPHASRTTSMDNVFYKVKTKFVRAKFRRATSCINNLEKIDTIELTSKVHHSSLLQLSRTDFFKNRKPQKEILKEKWLHASEGISLMNGDTTAEHVSR